MLNPKRSFLIYFDNAPMVNTLPPEQRGWLFSALLDYGDRVSRENLSPEAALPLYPNLEPQAQMVFQFIAATIDPGHPALAPAPEDRGGAPPCSGRGEAVSGSCSSDHPARGGGTGTPAPGPGVGETTNIKNPCLAYMDSKPSCKEFHRPQAVE